MHCRPDVGLGYQGSGSGAQSSWFKIQEVGVGVQSFEFLVNVLEVSSTRIEGAGWKA